MLILQSPSLLKSYVYACGGGAGSGENLLPVGKKCNEATWGCWFIQYNCFGGLSSQGFLSIALGLLRPVIGAPVNFMAVFLKWVLTIIMNCFLN